MDKENIKRGSFLKHLRSVNHISEEKLAELLDVEPSDIAVWETGIKFPDDSATIETLAKVFHVTKREILNGEYKKEKAAELEYKEKEDAEILSINNKNILIAVLSAVVILIIVVSIISIASSINKKVVAINVEPVSDEREEIIFTPKKINENIIVNTTAMKPREAYYDPSKLLNYGFVQEGNKYVKRGDKYTITFNDYVFHLSYKYSGSTIDYYHHLLTGLRYQDTTTTSGNVFTWEIDENLWSTDCTQYKCYGHKDYEEFIEFLSRKIRG